MPRKIAIVLIALLIVAMGAYVVVTSLSQEPLTIVGRWIHDNNCASYTFQKDGTVEIELPKLAPYTASYVLDEEAGVLEIQLIIDSQIQRQESAYSLSKDTLTLTNPETGSVVTMTRQSDDAQ